MKVVLWSFLEKKKKTASTIVVFVFSDTHHNALSVSLRTNKGDECGFVMNSVTVVQTKRQTPTESLSLLIASHSVQSA